MANEEVEETALVVDFGKQRGGEELTDLHPCSVMLCWFLCHLQKPLHNVCSLKNPRTFSHECFQVRHVSICFKLSGFGQLNF